MTPNATTNGTMIAIVPLSWLLTVSQEPVPVIVPDGSALVRAVTSALICGWVSAWWNRYSICAAGGVGDRLGDSHHGQHRVPRRAGHGDLGADELRRRAGVLEVAGEHDLAGAVRPPARVEGQVIHRAAGRGAAGHRGGLQSDSALGADPGGDGRLGERPR